MTDPLTIQPLDAFDATVRPPGSKSLTNRALLLAALADGVSHLSGVLFADDTRHMMDALKALGFKLHIKEEKHTVSVAGKNGMIPAKKAKLHVGNSGTTIRFLAAACTLGMGEYTLDGIPRMRERPIGELVEPLNELGAEIVYLGEEGYPPVKIIAEPPGIDGGFLELQPTLSSQFISAILMAAPCMHRGVEIEFDGPVTSLPYVKMTLNLMQQFGAKHEADLGYTAVHVPNNEYKAFNYHVEPDASNASYFLAAAAVVPGSRCVIEGLGSSSLQGDAEFCDVLGRMGCGIDQALNQTTLTAPANGRLRGITVDLNGMPDTAQTLAAVALFAEGDTKMCGIGNLRVKETDRLAALDTELTKLGATVKIDGEDMTITPPPNNQITPAAIDTYDDHRMAMSFAVVGLRQPGVTINDPDCVNKTFPTYFEHIEQLRSAKVQV